MIIKKYITNNNKINKTIKIGIFSDIHYSNTFKKNRLKQIKKSLISNKPDYICIPGDIVDKINVLDSKENKQNIITFFKELGEIAPTFISLGNHDNIRIINKRKTKSSSSFWTQELMKLKEHNVFLLVNEIYEIDTVRFIGYNPIYSYYNQESPDILIKDFNNKFKQIDNNKINILLCHSPIRILTEEVTNNIKSLKNIDIVISGHMHNGMLPNPLDKIFPKNRGIIAPNKKLFPNNARGIKKVIVNNKEICLVISGAITKISESTIKIIHFVDYLYQPQMEFLTIKK